MDLVEISYSDEAAQMADQPPHMIESIQMCWPGIKDLDIDEFCFILGNDYVELYGGLYVNVPAVIIRDIDGSFTKSNLIMSIDVKNFEVKGKMCIRSENKDPVDTEYKLSLDNVKMKMIIGMEVDDVTLSCDYWFYELENFDLSFLYGDNTEMSSVFDKMNDNNQKKLLKLHLAECFTRNIGRQLEYNVSQHFEHQTIEEDLDQSRRIRNITAIHVRRLHKTFSNLAKEIMTLTNPLLREELSKISLTNIVGISQVNNHQRLVKIYEGLICYLDSMIMSERTNVIVRNENDFVIVDVPVNLQKIRLYYKETTPDENYASKSEWQQMQTYTSCDAYFSIALERLSQDKVAFKLRTFRIMGMRALSEYLVKMTLDYLILAEIEDCVKKCLEKTLLCENLQAMAINPDIDLDYYRSDFDTGFQLFGDSPETSRSEDSDGFML